MLLPEALVLFMPNLFRIPGVVRLFVCMSRGPFRCHVTRLRDVGAASAAFTDVSIVQTACALRALGAGRDNKLLPADKRSFSLHS